MDAEAVTGGSSIPLTFDPAGLPADVKTAWPHLSGYDALRLPAKYANNKKLLTEILSGQMAVAEYDDLGRLVDATGVQIPGVLDDLYSGATKRPAGSVVCRFNPGLLAVGTHREECHPAGRPAGQSGRDQDPMGRDQDGIWTAWGKSRWLNGTLSVRGRGVRPGQPARSRRTWSPTRTAWR